MYKTWKYASVLIGSPISFLEVNNWFLFPTLPFSEKVRVDRWSKIILSSNNTTPFIVIKHLNGIIYWQGDPCGFKDSLCTYFMKQDHQLGPDIASSRLNEGTTICKWDFWWTRKLLVFNISVKIRRPCHLLLGWDIVRYSQIISCGHIVYSLLAIRSCSLFWPPNPK